MHLLILNWRCPTNPKSGGAEYIVVELAKRLIKDGHSVSWFAMSYAGAKASETISGIKVYRAGNPLTVQRAARKWYAEHAKEINLIIDQYHGIPFFAPRWAKCPVIFYVNEVAGEIAKYMLPFGLGYLYGWLEPIFIRQYKNNVALSISNSTTQEMKNLGYKGKIFTMPLACDTKPLAKLPALSTKQKDLTLLFAARLVPLKRPDHAIITMKYLRSRYPQAKLWILGSGQNKYEKYLHDLVSKNHLQKNIKFWGFVSLKEKQELMQQAHIVLITSIKEGWGLTVPEANALGTVGVTYNIAGVRDSNEHQETGLHSKNSNPASLAATIEQLWKDKKLYDKLRRAAWEKAKTRTWDKTYSEFKKAISFTQNKNSI